MTLLRHIAVRSDHAATHASAQQPAQDNRVTLPIATAVTARTPMPSPPYVTAQGRPTTHSDTWFSTLKPATISQENPGRTSQFLQGYPQVSLHNILKDSLQQRLSVLTDPMPSDEQILAGVSFKGLSDWPEFKTLSLPDAPTSPQIVTASQMRMSEREDFEKKREIANLYLEAALYEWQKKGTSEAYQKYQNCSKDLHTYRHLDEETRKQEYNFDRHIQNLATQARQQAHRSHESTQNHVLAIARNTLYAQIEGMALRHIQALPATQERISQAWETESLVMNPLQATGDDFESQPLAPVLTPFQAVENDVMTALESRLNQVIRYTLDQIERYADASPLRTHHLSARTPFLRIVAHTVPGLMATPDVFGLLGHHGHSTLTHRQEALAIVALLVDPARLTQPDKRLLQHELPLANDSPAMSAIITRHALFNDTTPVAFESTWVSATILP